MLMKEVFLNEVSSIEGEDHSVSIEYPSSQMINVNDVSR